MEFYVSKGLSAHRAAGTALPTPQVKPATPAAQTPATPDPKPEPKPAPKTDSVATTPAVQAGGGTARTFETQANFGTGHSDVAAPGNSELNKTLDAVIATFKTLPADKQKALLADPNFAIDITGHASNLGSAKKYDNLGLSNARAAATAAYVKDYLKKGGMEIPDSAVKSHGAGTPGKNKADDDNAQSDRSASVKVTMPGLPPAPPAPAVPAAKPATPDKPATADKPVTPAATDKPATPAATDKPATPTATDKPAASDTALAKFNETVGPLAGDIAKAGGQDTTLADREALAAKTQAALKSAEDQLPSLDPSAQLGARALLNGLKEQNARVVELAGKQRESLNKLQGDIKGEKDAINAAEGKKDKKELKELATKFLDKYKNPDTIGADLPKDARDALKASIADARKNLYEAIAKHSDDSKVDQRDNSYLFGRPGPKFKENWDKLKEIIGTSGPLNADQRIKATEALKDLGDATKDFEDPLAKEAAQAIYNQVSQAAYAKLAVN